TPALAKLFPEKGTRRARLSQDKHRGASRSPQPAEGSPGKGSSSGGGLHGQGWVRDAELPQQHTARGGQHVSCAQPAVSPSLTAAFWRSISKDQEVLVIILQIGKLRHTCLQ
ncbi:unnamed protein product, partial [Coccothraustes coccothraustes]